MIKLVESSSNVCLASLHLPLLNYLLPANVTKLYSLQKFHQKLGISISGKVFHVVIQAASLAKKAFCRQLDSKVALSNNVVS